MTLIGRLVDHKVQCRSVDIAEASLGGIQGSFLHRSERRGSPHRQRLLWERHHKRADRLVHYWWDGLLRQTVPPLPRTFPWQEDRLPATEDRVCPELVGTKTYPQTMKDYCRFYNLDSCFALGRWLPLRPNAQTDCCVPNGQEARKANPVQRSSSLWFLVRASSPSVHLRNKQPETEQPVAARPFQTGDLPVFMNHCFSGGENHRESLQNFNFAVGHQCSGENP